VKRSVSVPLQALMMGWGDVAEGYQGYAHTIAFLDEEGRHLEQWAYIGVTSRNWLERMEEHLQEIRSGSNKRFHAAWRSYAGNSQVILGSELIVLNHSFEGIMACKKSRSTPQCLQASRSTWFRAASKDSVSYMSTA
jgi:hypothetical protein